MVLYDLIIEAHHGEIQETFALARALAVVLGHTVIVRGNDVSVPVAPGATDEYCRISYETEKGLRR